MSKKTDRWIQHVWVLKPALQRWDGIGCRCDDLTASMRKLQRSSAFFLNARVNELPYGETYPRRN